MSDAILCSVCGVGAPADQMERARAGWSWEGSLLALFLGKSDKRTRFCPTHKRGKTLIDVFRESDAEATSPPASSPSRPTRRSRRR